jgi:hypothetical protein
MSDIFLQPLFLQVQEVFSDLTCVVNTFSLLHCFCSKLLLRLGRYNHGYIVDQLLRPLQCDTNMAYTGCACDQITANHDRSRIKQIS